MISRIKKTPIKSAHKHRIAFLLTCTLLPVAVSGCVPVSESGNLSDASLYTDEAVSQTTENADSQEIFSTDTDGLNTIIDLCGESVSLKFDEKMNDIMIGIEAPNRFYVYEDFGYYIPSEGRAEYKRMLSDTDFPDDETIFEMLPQDNFQRINKGEELHSLTLESAKGVLEVDEKGKTQFTRQWLDFSGNITLNGFVYIFANDEDAGYFDDGDVIFLADGGEWTGLPFNDRYMSASQWGADSSFFWAADAPIINLGNLSDYDISSLSDNRGKVSEVTVTLSNLSLRNDLCDIAYSDTWNVNVAVIEDIEFK